jgi:hypothetical protein
MKTIVLILLPLLFSLQLAAQTNTPAVQRLQTAVCVSPIVAEEAHLAALFAGGCKRLVVTACAGQTPSSQVEKGKPRKKGKTERQEKRSARRKWRNSFANALSDSDKLDTY